MSEHNSYTLSAAHQIRVGLLAIAAAVAILAKSPQSGAANDYLLKMWREK